MKLLDITGRRFGRLVAVRRVENAPGYGQARWLFECDCGADKVLFGYTAVHGLVKSCGCWRQDHPARFRHGLTGSREHRSWASMRGRCINPSNHAYHLYGGRGITVCKRWDKFENFLADMGKCPVGMTLDRKDNDGDYTTKNCRWATMKQQVRNRRTTTLYFHKVMRLTLQEWAEIYKLTYQHVWLRYKNGWRGERLFSPSRQNRKAHVQPDA